MDQLHLFISLLLRGSIISKCSIKMSGKVREKSGNLITTGEWQPCQKYTAELNCCQNKLL